MTSKVSVCFERRLLYAQIFLFFFEKPLDKRILLCYNNANIKTNR